jgi:hypothetical protein
LGNDENVAEPDRVRDAARELYTSDPAEFTGRRAELAAGARESGDAPAARAIAALRKPTRSAWVVNRLVHADPDVPSRLAALGADLRSAEESLDGRRIRELSQQRRELIGDLTRRALAEAGQRSAPASLQEEVSATFDAALADPEVAGDLAAGRLLRSVERAGFGFGEPSGGVAPAEGGRAPARPDRKQKPAREQKAKLQPARRKQERQSGAGAEKERAEAEKERTAERERAQAERARAEAQRRREAMDAACQAVAEADEAVEAAESSERDAAEAVDDLQRQLGDAYRRQADARRRARQAVAAQRKAHQALDRLTAE